MIKVNTSETFHRTCKFIYRTHAQDVRSIRNAYKFALRWPRLMLVFKKTITCVKVKTVLSKSLFWICRKCTILKRGEKNLMYWNIKCTTLVYYFEESYKSKVENPRYGITAIKKLFKFLNFQPTRSAWMNPFISWWWAVFLN